MKQFEYGYTLGKFLPPHNGHLHLIKEASKQCEHLTVLVCSLKNEPINGELRWDWLMQIFREEVFHGEITFIHVKQEVPQTPEEDVNFWPIWIDLMKKRIHPKTEVFFSSEKYGDDVAKHMKIQHKCIDIDRSTYNVSGTVVRANPTKYWEFLHPVVRTYLMKRVVIVGPESTGKSTLTGELNKYFTKSTTVDEYGRTYCDKNKPTTLTKTDFFKIAYHQYVNDWAARRKGAAEGKDIIFCDTDLIVTELYAKMCDLDVCLKDLIVDNKPDLYLLLDVDIDFQQDGQRIYIDQDRRKEHFELFKSKLIEYKCNFEVISSVGEQRTKNAINVINSKLNYHENY